MPASAAGSDRRSGSQNTGKRLDTARRIESTPKLPQFTDSRQFLRVLPSNLYFTDDGLVCISLSGWSPAAPPRDSAVLEAGALGVPTRSFFSSCMKYGSRGCVEIASMGVAFVGGNGRTPGRRFCSDRDENGCVAMFNRVKIEDSVWCCIHIEEIVAAFLDVLPQIIAAVFPDCRAIYLCAAEMCPEPGNSSVYRACREAGFRRKQGTDYVWKLTTPEERAAAVRGRQEPDSVEFSDS